MLVVMFLVSYINVVTTMTNMTTVYMLSHPRM
jgi:hypothetical protein